MWYDDLRDIAVVVAHPDDEVLWFGGLLTHHIGYARVICCSIPETEPVRALKFQEACDRLAVDHILLPFTEVRGGYLDGLECLNIADCAAVFTHNTRGEYGHLHHKQVHEAVCRKFRGPIYTSAYGDKRNTTLYVPVDWEAKECAIKCYNHTSKLMGVPKYKELLYRWGEKFDLKIEGYNELNA